MAAWISTEHGLPHPDTSVAVYIVQGDQEYPTLGVWSEDEGTWYLDWTFDNKDDAIVVAWYPLPRAAPEFEYEDDDDGEDDAEEAGSMEDATLN